ncbi:hypothetical protein N7497_007139 [Penicillium chrysogenum]|jgi:hypothetical protein|uniref:Uncharacterized protein n=1 Tax=Penicillium chrysogenum TaxID=5076 RepID=A0ABQ8W5B3_PENCH|nr:hypothetical protein N7505_010527 [Penicillium chrysogenum]KAJ5276415.1 hypothetical protein N7524_002568 [Penicillium chrysogenum]KAJ6152820.1 hypothetical protein N7497_007139 [Penicillium chrysogenum]
MEGCYYPVEPPSEHWEGRDTVDQPVLYPAILTRHPDNTPPRHAMSGKGQCLPLYDPYLDARNRQPFSIPLSPRVNPSVPYSQPTLSPEQVVQLLTIQQQEQLVLSQVLMSVGNLAFSQEQAAHLLPKIQQENQLTRVQIQSSMGNPGQPQCPMTLQPSSVPRVPRGI